MNDTKEISQVEYGKKTIPSWKLNTLNTLIEDQICKKLVDILI